MGNNGVFWIPYQSFTLQVIASDGQGWKHVSVSLPHRCPHWREMCFSKDLFWDEEDVGIQSHPAKSEYVNLHDTCLHLWRPVGVEIPTPPKEWVGEQKCRVVFYTRRYPAPGRKVSANPVPPS
jgi:hypothetical protein